MHIKLCTAADVPELAELNRQLIEDEKSDNRMTLEELQHRMKTFIAGEYNAYFFVEQNQIAGYALVKHTVKPVYLRQFLICREYRNRHLGKTAFNLLLKELNVQTVDLEVLAWNEAGQKFWQSCGFVERSKYMRLNGEKHDRN